MNILKRLYATVDINKENSKGKIKYYEVQGESYGVEIVREENSKVLQTKAIENITDKQEGINKVLEILTNNLVTPETVEYIEEDLIY